MKEPAQPVLPFPWSISDLWILLYGIHFSPPFRMEIRKILCPGSRAPNPPNSSAMVAQEWLQPLFVIRPTSLLSSHPTLEVSMDKMTLCCSAYDIRFIGQVVCNKIDIIVLTSTYGGNCGICYLTLILLFWHKWPIRKCSQYPDSPKRDSMLSVTLWNFHAIWVNLCIESCHQRQKKPQIIERQNILLLPTAPCSVPLFFQWYETSIKTWSWAHWSEWRCHCL